MYGQTNKKTANFEKYTNKLFKKSNNIKKCTDNFFKNVKIL